MKDLKPILLAEDDPRDAELTLSALAENNILNKVIVVSDGAEALDYLHYRGRFADREREPPSVILLDLKMPKVDGLEVLRAVKGDERLRRIPVVMLTSSKEEGDLIRCYDGGANSYVVKPVDFAQFISAVQQIGVFWTLHNEAPPEHTSPAKN